MNELLEYSEMMASTNIHSTTDPIEIEKRNGLVALLRLSSAYSLSAADCLERGDYDRGELLSRKALEAIEEARSFP